MYILFRNHSVISNKKQKTKIKNTQKKPKQTSQKKTKTKKNPKQNEQNKIITKTELNSK